MIQVVKPGESVVFRLCQSQRSLEAGAEIPLESRVVYVR